MDIFVPSKPVYSRRRFLGGLVAAPFIVHASSLMKTKVLPTAGLLTLGDKHRLDNFWAYQESMQELQRKLRALNINQAFLSDGPRLLGVSIVSSGGYSLQQAFKELTDDYDAFESGRLSSPFR